MEQLSEVIALGNLASRFELLAAQPHNMSAERARFLQLAAMHREAQWEELNRLADSTPFNEAA